MTPDFCLQTSHLSHRYREGGKVLRDLSLHVPTGSIYGFLGPNGAGKTTTLRLVLGLLRRQAGAITIFGQDLEKHRLEILRRIGSLIESPSLYSHLTARENLLVWQKIYRCPKERIDEVLKLVGLSDTGTKKSGRFSLGMKQRLGIAVALLPAPALLILDEPTNGLDPTGIIEIRELVQRLNREERVTIVISSHLLAEMERLATDLGIIHRGQLVFEGTMGELQHKQREVVYVRTDDNAAALEVIRRAVPQARREDDKIVLPGSARGKIAGVNRALVASGRDVHEIRPVRDDLETIFMNLIGEPRQ